MSTPLESIADRIRQHPKLVIADDFEIALQRTHSQGVRFHNGELRQESEGERLWVSLRIHHRKRGGKSVCFNPSIESLNGLVEAAFESANRAAVDPWFRFPMWKTAPKSAVVENAPVEYASLFDQMPAECSVFDEAYDQLSTETLIRRKTERSELRHAKQAHLASFSLVAQPGSEVVFLREERAQSGELSERKEWVGDLVQTTAGRAKRPAKPCGKGRRRTVLAPRVAARLLRAMAPWFSAEAIQTGRSPLLEHLGKPLFSEVLTLWDDGTHPGSTWSGPFDLEGTPTQKTLLVDKGVAKGWLFDVYTATRDNRLSTGNFLRAPADAYPGIRPSGFHFQPGAPSRQGLLEQMGNGIYIDSLDSVEILAEEQCRVAFRGSGWRVAFGQCSEPLQSIIGQMDILELFRRASGVARDLGFFAGVGSPSILLEDVPLGN